MVEPVNAEYRISTMDYGFVDCMSIHWHNYQQGVRLVKKYYHDESNHKLMRDSLTRNFWRYLGAA